MDGKVLKETVNDKCVLTCRDFLNEELPDLANQYLARYLALQIDGDLPEIARTIKGEYRVQDESDCHQCVRVLTSEGKEHSIIILGLNLTREQVAVALDRLMKSDAKERLLIYLFSFESIGDEELISEAVMEGDLMGMVRDTGITVFFAMLDARAGMGMLARIDGERRMIEYLPH